MLEHFFSFAAILKLQESLNILAAAPPPDSVSDESIAKLTTLADQAAALATPPDAVTPTA